LVANLRRNKSFSLKKFWKIFLIVLLVLLLLLAAVVIYAVTTFKPNDLKPRITDYFQQKYQRKLVIPGDLHLSLWPVLHIESGPLSLMEKNGKDVFASLQSVKTSLLWRSLIDGRFEVNDVTLDAPSLHIQRFADGTTNIDDFFAGGGATPPFDIKGLKINNASLQFDNQQARWNISKAHLAIGRLANNVATEVSFNADVLLNKDDMNLHVDVKSPLQFDLDKQSVAMGKIVLAISGTTKADGSAMNQVTLHATGAMALDGVKKTGLFNDWNLQSQMQRDGENWKAQVSFAEAVQEGKNWRAKNISSQAEQQTAAYSLNTTLTAPAFTYVDERMSGNELKLAAQWKAKPAPSAKKTAQPTPDAIDAVLTIGALDDVNNAGDHANMVNLQGAHLEAKGVIDHAPVKIQADSDMQIINNNQIVTKTPLKLTFNYQPEGVALEGSLKTGAQIMLEQGQYDMTAMTLDMKMVPKDFKQAMALNGSGSVRADLKRKNISAALKGVLNKTKLEGKFGMVGFTPPAYTFDVLLSQFDTAWLEPKTVAAKTPTELPDFAWIKKLNANGVLQIGELIAADKRATNVRIEVK
jgi:AsmA family